MGQFGLDAHLISDILNLDKRIRDRGYNQGIVTPGVLREIIIGNALGHLVHNTKHGSDATDPFDETKGFEYLAAYEGASCQIDRIDETNFDKIEKNHRFYFVFFGRDRMDVYRIYEVETDRVLKSAQEKIRRCKERAKKKGKEWTSKHVGWTEKNVKEDLGGNVVFDNMPTGRNHATPTRRKEEAV